MTLKPTLLPPRVRSGPLGAHGQVPGGPQRTAGLTPRGEAAGFGHSSLHAHPSSKHRSLPRGTRTPETPAPAELSASWPAEGLGPQPLSSPSTSEPEPGAPCAPRNPQSPSLWPVLFRKQKALTPLRSPPPPVSRKVSFYAFLVLFRTLIFLAPPAPLGNRCQGVPPEDPPFALPRTLPGRCKQGKWGRRGWGWAVGGRGEKE